MGNLDAAQLLGSLVLLEALAFGGIVSLIYNHFWRRSADGSNSVKYVCSNNPKISLRREVITSAAGYMACSVLTLFLGYILMHPSAVMGEIASLVKDASCGIQEIKQSTTHD